MSTRDDDVTARLAHELLHRLTAQLGVGALEPALIDAPTFGPDNYRIGPHPISSIEMIEFLVLLEKDFGMRLISPYAIADVSTIRDLAMIIQARADHLAVARFCGDWPEQAW
jgi:hypothetical protein